MYFITHDKPNLCRLIVYLPWCAPYQISIGPKVQLVSVLISISTLILSIPDYHGYTRSNNIHTHANSRLHNCKSKYWVVSVCLNCIQRVGIYTRNIDSFIKLWRSVCSEHRGLGPPSLFYLNRPGDSANLEAREQVAIKPWCATPTMPTNQDHVTYYMNVGVN